VEVVVVYDDAGDGPANGLRLVPKWGAFDRLAAAVEGRRGDHSSENGASGASG
jgi:hypothetical protein